MHLDQLFFQDKVSWDPRHHDLIYNTFKQRCAKRLSDMLSKARKKGAKPSWVEDEAWAGLLTYWASQDFQKVSTQNKTNRASNRGGAVHTTGRKAHHEVALDMVCFTPYLLSISLSYDVWYL